MSDFRAAHYLQIPAEYCRSFGGLRWAQYGEAVEFLEGPAAGRTFAFAAEIAVFLEGMHDAPGAFLSFGFVLHLLYLVGLGERAARHGESSATCVERIAAPFRALGCPLRNAGALCASLCQSAPPSADPPVLSALCEILTGGSWIPRMVLSDAIVGVMDHAEEPGLAPAEFEAEFRRAADSLTDDAIRHWLRHGRGPAGAVGEQLPPIPPKSLVETLAELEQNPRLAGIGRLVSRLEGALSLPPRRLAWSVMQDGGYSDVSTTGAPEQILPIQFALEGEEFLRRFAEGELLYFHREEPRQPTTQEMILLLDQGVRTWGDVRLVLCGAAVALARQADRQRIAIKLATTSNDGEAVDPSKLEPRSLSGIFEASDLSPHPGHALARLLDSLNALERDIVLLTHPKNLAEPDVVAATRSRATDRGTRIFAVSVDSGGQLEFAELRRGLPVVLARSRITITEERAATVIPSSAAPLAMGRGWKGNVERIPFPFQCGTLDRIDCPQNDGRCHFDFDEAGERILVVGRFGLLFCWRIDGTDVEILPRPLVDGEVLRAPRTVIGVAGGFVVVCRHHPNQVLAHYDFPTRTCNVYVPSDREPTDSWHYFRELHSVAAPTATRARLGPAVDLAARGEAAATTSRAVGASILAQFTPSPLVVANAGPFPIDRGGDPQSVALRLDTRSGTLYLRHGAGDDRSLTPRCDGRPALKGSNIVHARQGGDVIALLVERGTAPGLYFLSLSRATVLGTFFLGAQPGASNFALSRDGHRFARTLDERSMEVRDVPGGGPPVLVTREESLWIHFATLGRSCLCILEFELAGPRRARSSCLIRWDRGRLEVFDRDAEALLAQLGGPVAVSRSLSPAQPSQGPDPHRFVQFIEHKGVRVLIDRYNHLAVLDKNGDLTCMFYVSGNEIAASLPDGTRCGSRRHIGGEPTPGASERVAAALTRVLPGEGRSS
jgi:hypothetical protein